MDIDLIMRDAKVMHCKHRDTGKGFVDLEQVDIAHRPTRLCKTFGNRPSRSTKCNAGMFNQI
jgi:hypothetical protein